MLGDLLTADIGKAQEPNSGYMLFFCLSLHQKGPLEFCLKIGVQVLADVKLIFFTEVISQNYRMFELGRDPPAQVRRPGAYCSGPCLDRF